MKKQWLIPCVLASCMIVFCSILCCVLIAIGSCRLITFLPTIQPKPTLTVNRTYWIGELIPPVGLPKGLVMPSANILNKPQHSIDDPSVTLVGVLRDATPVTLIGIRGDWCYIKAVNEFGRNIEGWMNCDQLLDYEPTPFPTPNLTPEKP